MSNMGPCLAFAIACISFAKTRQSLTLDNFRDPKLSSSSLHSKVGGAKVLEPSLNLFASIEEEKLKGSLKALISEEGEGRGEGAVLEKLDEKGSPCALRLDALVCSAASS